MSAAPHRRGLGKPTGFHSTSQGSILTSICHFRGAQLRKSYRLSLDRFYIPTGFHSAPQAQKNPTGFHSTSKTCESTCAASAKRSRKNLQGLLDIFKHESTHAATEKRFPKILQAFTGCLEHGNLHTPPQRRRFRKSYRLSNDI